MKHVVRGIAWATAIAIFCGCSRGAAGIAPIPPAVSQSTAYDFGPAAANGRKIQHVIVVVQENRSFDNLFATFPGADGHNYGRAIGIAKLIPLRRRGLATGEGEDLGHGHRTFVQQYDGGKMDGFILSGERDLVYSYVNPADVQPYWRLARRYVIADRMFMSHSSASYTAHQDLIRGDSKITPARIIVDNPTGLPWGCDAQPGSITHLLTRSGQMLPNRGPFPCYPFSTKFPYPTLADLLDAKNISWKYYVQTVGSGLIWNAFDSIASVACVNYPGWAYVQKHDGFSPCVRGRDWANIVHPETSIFGDISNGRLANVSWVIPNGLNSDHPGYASDTGPSWVASIVNAVGESRYWDSTAIVVVWDDWGGFYDAVPPPQLDFAGLGFRVPCLIVSPYSRVARNAKQGYVSHTQYEFGSILKFIEDNWNLGRLHTTDDRATSIVDSFDFTKPPRPFETIEAKYSKDYFLHQKASTLPPDDE